MGDYGGRPEESGMDKLYRRLREDPLTPIGTCCDADAQAPYSRRPL